MTTLYFESELYHHGVKGMKWGVRRYQNPDGTLTEAGKRRQAKAYTKELNDMEIERAKLRGRFIETDYRARRMAERGRTGDKLRRVVEKRDSYRKAYEKLDSDILKKMGDVAKEGYPVVAKQMARELKKGRNYVAAFLGGPLAVAGVKSLEILKYGDKYAATTKNGKLFTENPSAVLSTRHKVIAQLGDMSIDDLLKIHDRM